MKKLVNILIPAWSILMLALLLASCGSSRKTVSTDVKTERQSDSVSVTIKETIRRDTINIPGEKLIITQTVPCPDKGVVSGDTNQGKKPITQTAQSGHVKLRTTYFNGQFTAECDSDSLKLVIEAKDREIERIEKSKSQSTQVKTLERIVVKYRWPWWLIIAVIVMAVLVVITYANPFIHKFLPQIQKLFHWKS